MFKFLSIAVLGTVGLLSTASAAEVCGGRCCAAAPQTCAAMPGMPGMAAPPAPGEARAGTQVYRSYSYEPSYRSDNRSYRSPSRSQYDAGRKVRGL